MSQPDEQRRSGSRAVHRLARRRGTGRVIAAGLGFGAFVFFMINGTGAGGTPASPADTMTISAKASTDHECNSSEWHFVINQIDTAADAPASIHVSWANGQSEDVPLLKFTGGVAHYVTTDNLDSTVTSATAVIYAGWSGQFNLSHGPCGAPPSSSSSSSSSSSPSGSPSS
jgi:hypothetical protein